MIMKKVLLVLALGVSAMILSSCFGRECVCTYKVDGDKTAKSIDYQDECEKTGEWTIEEGSAESILLYDGKEAKVKCK